MKVLFKKYKQIAFVFIGIIGLVLLVIFLPKILSGHYVLDGKSKLLAKIPEIAVKPVFVPSYIPTPSTVKGIYMTSWTAGTPTLRKALVKLIDETELNTVIIDIKDYSGKVVFKIDSTNLLGYGSEDVRILDLADFIESLHRKNIYVIGRIAVFQDEYFVKFRPDLAVKTGDGSRIWKDKKGISWIDPGSREYWDYIILISKESRKVGFDEINFDYIRFPSDGNMQDISYPWSTTTPKATVLEEFFKYLQRGLVDSGLKTSADLFGMVTTARNDMGIGQVLEKALPYFDYVSPMVYPSHYPTTFQGFINPEAHPYEVVHFSMQSAVTRAEALASTTGQSILDYKNKLRPWLQDFGLRMTYGPAEVQAQIKATSDVGLTSWMLWSASNKYTRGALQGE